MLASEFVKAVQEAGFSFEKIVTTDVNTKKQHKGIKVHVGSNSREVSLDIIKTWDVGEVNRTFKQLRDDLNFEEDFDNLPEKG